MFRAYAQEDGSYETELKERTICNHEKEIAQGLISLLLEIAFLGMEALIVKQHKTIDEYENGFYIKGTYIEIRRQFRIKHG